MYSLCSRKLYYFIVESHEFSFFRDKRFFRRKAGKSRAGRTTQLVKSPGISRGFPAAERGGLMLSAIAAADVGVGVSGRAACPRSRGIRQEMRNAEFSRRAPRWTVGSGGRVRPELFHASLRYDSSQTGIAPSRRGQPQINHRASVSNSIPVRMPDLSDFSLYLNRKSIATVKIIFL